MVRLIEAKGGDRDLIMLQLISSSLQTVNVKGFKLKDGTEITANKRGVVTALDPKQTFLRLIEPENLNDSFLNHGAEF